MNTDDTQSGSPFWDVVDRVTGVAQVTMWVAIAAFAITWAAASVVFVTTH